MRRPALFLLVVGLTLAGCAAPNGAPSSTNSTTPSVTIDESRPEPSFNDIPNANLGVVAAPDIAATLREAPQLRAGEWWRIQLDDELTGATTQFVRVVARVESDLYVFGMPHEGWWKEAVVFHSPGFGDVNKDLSHRAHDFPFLPLKFPLEDGASWETKWETPSPVTATVSVESPTTARIKFSGTSCGVFALVGQCPTPAPDEGVVELLYDATMHEVVEAKFKGTHSWRVLEHGYGYEGWVTVPRAEKLVFLHGRLGASTYDFVNGAPAGPSDIVPVDGGYNRVSFILANGNLAAEQGGAYRETATAPDGTAFTLENVPGGALSIAFFEHSNPDGEWTLEHIVAGGGYGFVEGIAYHQYDIRLPDGAVRSDHNHEVVR